MHNFMLDKITCSQSLTIEALNMAGDVLLLGEDYQYVNPSSIDLRSSSRKNVDLQINLLAKKAEEDYPRGYKDRLYLGEMQFWKELDFGLKGANSPPRLCALIFMQEDFFFDICQRILSGTHVSHLEISMSDVDWDWDPDGNKIIWQPNIDGEYLKKPISAINLGINHSSVSKPPSILKNHIPEKVMPISVMNLRFNKIHLSFVITLICALIAIILLDAVFR